MTRYLFYSFLIAILTAGCTLTSNEYEIIGEVQHAKPEQKLYLSRLELNGKRRVDTTRLNEEGRFVFTGKIDTAGFYALEKSHREFITLIIHPGDEITLSTDNRDFPDAYEVEGSKDSRLIKQLHDRRMQSVARLDSLGEVFRKNRDNPDLPDIKAGLDSSYEQIIENQRESTIRFIKDNPGSLANILALYQKITSRNRVLDPIEDHEYFEFVDSNLFARYPENPEVRGLHFRVSANRQLVRSKLVGQQDRLAKGTVAPEIRLPDPQGDTLALSSLRGQYVLLDFWAAWCAPCRRENPNLVKNYNKYHDRGFEIYQVSLDDSRKLWLEAIEKDQLDWYHVSDLKKFDSPVVDKYNLKGIPANFLLDKQGRIIAKNLRGEKLGNKLEEIFNP